MIIATLVLVAGSAVSFLTAEQSASGEQRSDRERFERTASEVAGELDRSIQRHEDLVVSIGAFVSESPLATSTVLGAWLERVQARSRYPELLAVGLVTVVQHDQLDEFQQRQIEDPATPTGTPAPIIPPGDRTFYCLLQASIAYEIDLPVIPTSLDYCAGDFGLGALPQEARDSGEPSYVAIALMEGEPQLVVQAPIYRDGVVPFSIGERQAAYVGNLGLILSPEAVFSTVMQEYPSVVVNLTYRADGEPIVFSSDTGISSAESTTITFGNGWSATVSRRAPTHGILTSTSTLTILVLGILAATLLAIVVYSLGTGRARARRLVRERTAELEHQALHDSLTGLPNRTLIIDRVEQLLSRCRRQGSVGAALFVDLDNFKNVNDSFGHDAGDRLLTLVTGRMNSVLQAVDTIGRMGGDEFVVLVQGDSSEALPEVVAQRLLSVLGKPFELEVGDRCCTLHVTASIGIASGDRSSAGDLLRDADLALYQAKGAGRNCYIHFRPEMQVDVRRRLELEIELRAALDNGELELYYQPIYHLADLTVVGAEALLRWNNPTRGVIQPDAFIPILEHSGEIVQVGRWVMNDACRQVAEWRRGGSNLTVSVNVSARQLDHASIVCDVQQALIAAELEPTALTVEVTETALMRDPTAVAQRLRDIKKLGVRIAIDDFGTGYSSLAYLQQFAVDSLKIDRAFTNALTLSAEANALIRTFARLGNDLGLTTLAEGVETIEQLDQLRHEHVEQVQGYLLARPMTADAFRTTILHEPTRNDLHSDVSVQARFEQG